MSVEDLRERLSAFEEDRGSMPLYEYFVDKLQAQYESYVDRWIWANDRVLDHRPLWVQRESPAPEAAAVLPLPPLDKSYKWNYGLDKDGRVIIARQENDNDSELSLYKYSDDIIEGVHYCSYDSNSVHYILVSECLRQDGRVVSHTTLCGHEVDSEEYEHDEEGRVVRITRERNFLTPEAESERARKLRANLEALQKRRADLGIPQAVPSQQKVAPAKPDLIVLEYTASWDDKGVTSVQLESDGNSRVVYQRR